MRKDFYVFRHGETDYNLEKRWQGCGIDIDLNQTGKQQAKDLAEKMQTLKIEIIYSSPLKRAYQTAQAVSEKTNAQIKIIPELTEASVGLCEGLTRDEIANKYPEIWEKWYNDDGNINWSIRWPKGESKQEIKDRLFTAFEKILNTKETTIGIASHSGSIRYFLLGLGYGPHKMPNTALFHIIYEDGKWIFDKLM